MVASKGRSAKGFGWDDLVERFRFGKGREKARTHALEARERLEKLFGATGLKSAAESSAEPAESNGVADDSFTVEPDKDDYAPGATAEFTVTGVSEGGTVRFEVSDLPGDPGKDGIVNAYEPFEVTDGGPKDLDGATDGGVIAAWIVPPDPIPGDGVPAPADGATLEVRATDLTTGATATANFEDALPPPIQTYFVPLRENELYDTFNAIDGGTPSTTIETIISIGVAAPGTIIYYDHWEDGYEVDVTSPTQASTLIWGDGVAGNGVAPGTGGTDVFSGGESIVLENVVPTPRNAANILFDGADRIQTSFPIAVTRGAFPTSPGSLLAGAVEVLDTDRWGDDFTAPVGENTIISTSDPFEYSAIYVMAAEANTPIYKNGVLETTLASAGDNAVIRVDQGDRVTTFDPTTASSGKSVQADLVAGDIDSTYELRWYSLLPTEEWSNDYYTPVGDSAGGGGNGPTRVYLYNPGNSDITVSYDFLGGASPDGTITVLAGETARSVPIPDDSGARFFTTGSENFFALTQTDVEGEGDFSSGQIYDWGHPLIPANQLTSQALISWGWGNTTNNPNIASRSVVWVTPVADATINIDFNGDGTVDNTVIASALSSTKILDDSSVYSGAENDQDMSGAVIFATDSNGDPVDIAVAWGQDPELSGSGDVNALDLGTTVPPLPELTAGKSASLFNDVDNDGQFDPGDTIEYTITVLNFGRVDVPAGGYSILDFFSPVFDDTEYVEFDSGAPANTTGTQYTVNINAGGTETTTTLADDGAGTLFPLDADSTNGFTSTDLISPQEIQTFKFRVVIDEFGNLTPGTTSITNEGVLRENNIPVEEFDVTVPLDFDAGIDIEKFTNGDDADAPTGPSIALGDPVTWTYEVTNTGSVWLSSISVTDNQLGTITNLVDDGDGDSVLQPGETWIYEASGTAQLGQYVNEGTATGNPVYADGSTPVPGVSAPTDSDFSHYFGFSNPDIELDKFGTLNDDDGTPGVSEGDTISYTFRVENDGNVTLSNVTLADTVGGVTISGGPITSLAPGAVDTTTFTGSYTITQADIDAGTFDNVALVTGTDPGGNTVTDPGDEQTPLGQTPDIELDKFGTLNDDDGTPGVSEGDTISYTFRVENDGNVTLSNITLADTVGGVTISGGPITSLAPGAVDTTTFTGSYTITQADIDAGTFDNVALVTGTDPGGNTVTDPGDEQTPLGQTPDIELDKFGTLNDDDGTPGVSEGDTISYTFRVENDGNVTLSNITLADTVGGVTISGGPITSLAPGAVDTTTFTGSYTITQADIDAGTFDNVALVTGTDPGGNTVTDPGDEQTPLGQTPDIELDKFGTLNDDDGTPGVSEGDTISYTFRVENDGNVTLSNVTLADTVGGVTISGGPITSLAPGAVDTTTFTGSYTITQADIDAGTFDNVALVTGTDPGGNTVTDPGDEQTPLGQTPDIELDKFGTLNDDDGTPGVSEGDTISYTFRVENDGNVTLSNVTLADTVGGVTISGGPITSLAPGAVDTTTFTGSYTITQADIDAGTFDNVALVTGTDPGGNTVTDPGDEQTPLGQTPDIELDKFGTLNDDDGTPGVSEGDTISYTFRVENDGNVTLSNVTLADTVGGVTISGGPITSLAPGAVDTTTFTGSYTITQADIDAGTFDNVALVTGTDPGGNTVTDPGDEQTPLGQTPDIELDKFGTLNDDDGTPGVSEGDTISYTFRVENDGNVTLSNITLADTVGGVTISGGPITSLAPGAVDTTTFTGSYTITQADIDAGTFDNVALVTGTDPGGNTVTDPGDEQTPLGQTPDIELDKFGTLNDDDGTPGVSEGDTISYTFRVENDGNVTLSNITLADTVGGVTISGGPITSLAPGAVDTTTFTGSYTITQADIDAGTFDNVALVTGTDPGGNTVTDPGDEQTPLGQTPDIELDKFGTLNDDDGTPGVSEGDTISYTFRVENDGNVTLSNVTLADTVGGVTISGGPITSLAPGAVDTTTFTGSYTITQADIDAGTFDNVALVTGTDPGGNTVTDPGDEQTPLGQTPDIELDEFGTLNDDDGTPGVSEGDTISDTFRVENDGNVTLSNVTLADTVGGVTISGGPITSLAPGAVDTTTFTGSYTTHPSRYRCRHLR